MSRVDGLTPDGDREAVVVVVRRQTFIILHIKRTCAIVDLGPRFAAVRSCTVRSHPCTIVAVGMKVAHTAVVERVHSLADPRLVSVVASHSDLVACHAQELDTRDILSTLQRAGQNTAAQGNQGWDKESQLHGGVFKLVSGWIMFGNLEYRKRREVLITHGLVVFCVGCIGKRESYYFLTLGE
jgi:hypothetical protein